MCYERNALFRDDGLYIYTRTRNTDIRTGTLRRVRRLTIIIVTTPKHEYYNFVRVYGRAPTIVFPFSSSPGTPVCATFESSAVATTSNVIIRTAVILVTNGFDRAGGCRWTHAHNTHTRVRATHTRTHTTYIVVRQAAQRMTPRGRKEPVRGFDESSSAVFSVFSVIFAHSIGDFSPPTDLTGTQRSARPKTASKSAKNYSSTGSSASFAPILRRTNTASVFFMAVRPSASFE